ncbi:hypothetical protein Droror1_Dr00026874 [Drosera rotundifolia]
MADSSTTTTSPSSSSSAFPIRSPPPIYRLPPDTLHTIISTLPLRQIILLRSVSKPFHQTLTSPPFLSSLHHPPLPLLALRPPHHHHHTHHRNHHLSIPSLHAFDASANTWFAFPLSFLPFRSLTPVTSGDGLVYLWGEREGTDNTFDGSNSKSLVVCNPVVKTFRVLPQLGSAWSKHGSVVAGVGNRVMVLSELATLFYGGGGNGWMPFGAGLPSKPRSPVMVRERLYALCDVGTPWRSQWKLYTCGVPGFRGGGFGWGRLERVEWGDVFDIMKRPRLVRGVGNVVLMVGGLKSSFSLNATCTTIVILRLDLQSLEWDEAGRMPAEMYRCFQESSKFKVFGGGERVCFAAKRVGKLALWDCSVEGEAGGVWRWIDGVPGYGDGLCRGFVFEARLDAVP